MKFFDKSPSKEDVVFIDGILTVKKEYSLMYLFKL